MEEFSSDIQRVLKQPAFSSEMNPSNLELLNSLSQVNQPLSSQLLNYLSVDNLLTHASTAQPHPLPPYSNEPIQFHFPENSTFDQTNGTGSQSYPVFVGDATTDGNLRMDKNNRSTGKKRKRKGEELLEKPKEVIHVRAKRGQATDSHSLAERVRRERINEKLKVLQDLVPGCYKTMGMAVMLDVIINYVQSLQNQIEFLSMKLSAASMFYDFNSPEAEAIENLQRTTTNTDAHEMERVARGGNGETMDPRLHSTWPF